MTTTDTTWADVLRYLHLPAVAEPGPDRLDDMAGLIEAGLHHATEEELSDWWAGVMFITGATGKPADAVYHASSRRIIRLAARLYALADLQQDGTVGYGDVRELERAYTGLGEALEAVKAVLAEEG